MPRYKDFDPAKRLWPRLDTTDPNACWEWPGARQVAGYGVFRINYKLHLTHRLAWELTNGAIPQGMHVCHKCDNPPCCNPAHLFLGTPGDNMRDAAKKRRIPHGEGHPDSKLTNNNIKEIFRLAQSDLTRTEIARRFSVARGTITDVLYRRTWKHIKSDTSVPNHSHGIHHPQAKLSPNNVREIRRLSDRGLSQRKLAKQFSVSRGTIEAILKGTTWKHVN